MTGSTHAGSSFLTLFTCFETGVAIKALSGAGAMRSTTRAASSVSQSSILAALKAIRHLKSRLVFCHDDGSRWTLTTMRTGIARQEKRAGLRRTGWHVLRHSFCSHLAGRGVAAVVIKKLAGHSSIAVTNRYMHESEGDLREAISRLGGDRLATTA